MISIMNVAAVVAIVAIAAVAEKHSCLCDHALHTLTIYTHEHSTAASERACMVRDQS